MPTHVRDPNLYLNDRNIYDGLKTTRKATSSVLLALARQRGIILYDGIPNDDLIRYLSRLTHSWNDLRVMLELVNTANRAERWATSTLPFNKPVGQLERVLRSLQEKQASARDEVWQISSTSRGKDKSVIVTIRYTMPDFSKSAMIQLTEHICRIEFTPDGGTILVRHPKQDRAEQLVAAVLGALNDEKDTDLDLTKIELSDVTSNRLRSMFFTRLAEGLPGFRLSEIPSVRGNHGDPTSAPTRLERRATAAIQSAVRRVSLHGTSITGTSEYRQFFGKAGAEANFYITAITWIADELETSGLRVEFEASFTNQAACSGFVYRVRKVWYRTEDGALRRTGVAPQLPDQRRLMKLIETQARRVCDEIKNASSAARRPAR